MGVIHKGVIYNDSLEAFGARLKIERNERDLT